MPMTLSGTTGILQPTAAAPAFSAYQSSAQAFSSATATKVLFQTESFDTNSNFSNSRFTPTVAGYYFCQFSFLPPSVSRTSEIQVLIGFNGVNGPHSGFDTNGAGVASTIICSMSALIYFNGTTDYAEALAYCGVGGTTAPGGQYTQFQAFLARSA